MPQPAAAAPGLPADGDLPTAPTAPPSPPRLPLPPPTAGSRRDRAATSDAGASSQKPATSTPSSSTKSRAPRRPPTFVRSATVSKMFCFSIWINQLYMGLTALAPKTLGVYQVRLFFVGANEDRIGPATGALSAAFAAAQLSTMFLWGWVSDVTGRPKLLILLANVGCGVGSTWFAFATNYGEALASRVVAGMTMASGVVLKAVLGQTLEKDAQAIAMAYRTLGAGCAQILTPIVIGQLANPCSRFGLKMGCGPNGFLHTHPFALSGVIIAAVGIVSTLCNFFIFPDIRTSSSSSKGAGSTGTSDGRRRARGEALGTISSASEPGPHNGGGSSVSRPRPSVPTSAFAAAALVAPPVAAAAAASTAPAQQPSRRAGPAPAVSFASAPASTPLPPASLSPPKPNLNTIHTVATPASTSLRTRRASTRANIATLRSAAASRNEPARTALATAATTWGFEGMAGADYGGEADLDAARAAAASVRRQMSLPGRQSSRPASTPSTAPPGDPEAAAPPPETPWWRHRPALLAVSAYAAVTFLFDAYLDLVNLYGSAPRTCIDPLRTVPGLALPIAKLSWIITLGGACVVAFSLLAYPPLQRRIGVSKCATFGLAAGIPTALIPPLAYYAWPAGQGAELAVLAVGQIAYGVSFASTSTSSQILTNLCAPDGQIGSVNGAGNTLSSFVRVVGPLITGGLWAIAARAVDKDDQWLPFGLLSGFFAVTLVVYVGTGLTDADMGGG